MPKLPSASDLRFADLHTSPQILGVPLRLKKDLTKLGKRELQKVS